MNLTPAERPTFYFIGVTTAGSSIMKVFPKWAEYLGLGNIAIAGIDLPLHAPAASYRAVVDFLRNDPLSRGALVTTHKLDLYAACADMFDEIDPHARLMAETSCLSRRQNRFRCHAKDPISSGLSLDGFLPKGHFAGTDAALFSMGAGGSTIAITWHLLQKRRGDDRPSRIIVSNRSKPRLDHIRAIHAEIGADIPCDYIYAAEPWENDQILSALPAGSLVINATGLGKDAPGSPLTDEAEFPEAAIVWELNYRGDLVFLWQAQAQQNARHLQVEDGWTYFIHGWTQVIAEVFDIDIAPSGPQFETLSQIAAEAAGRK
ncbi:MAG: shikimate dehydrogenase [Alphaproteobacteria bacterium]|nr:shikimate dehydrogenase [Alphaproteobacteria bacterium]